MRLLLESLSRFTLFLLWNKKHRVKTAQNIRVEFWSSKENAILGKENIMIRIRNALD